MNKQELEAKGKTVMYLAESIGEALDKHMNVDPTIGAVELAAAISLFLDALDKDSRKHVSAILIEQLAP